MLPADTLMLLNVSSYTPAHSQKHKGNAACCGMQPTGDLNAVSLTNKDSSSNKCLFFKNTKLVACPLNKT